MLRRVIAACGLFAVALAAAAATWRVEVHPFESRQFSGAALLAAADDAQPDTRPVTLAGELRRPVTDAARVPAVVFLHGDGGALSNHPLWADALNAAGIAVFTLDSFSGRGFVSRDTHVTPLASSESAGALVRMADAYRALALLARHPRIDASRIALAGASGGARATLNAAMRRFARPFAPADGPAFAAFIGLYAPCNVRLIGDTDVLRAPLRLFSGEADVITQAAPCREYVQRLRAAGADAQITVYAGAGHGFDATTGPVSRNDAVPNSAGCRFEERERGRLVNAATGAPLAAGDACMSRGMTGGPDAAARAAVHADVIAFLRATIAPPR
jgi:dienelactone hydrolase